MIAEGVVTHMPQPGNIVFRTGDGEVPGQIQRVVAGRGDPRRLQHREHVAGQCIAALGHRWQLRGPGVAAGGERGLGGNRSTGLINQRLQHHDIALPFVKVGGRTD